MKKRKILYLFPLAALVLSGCTFQEGWEITKNWTNEKVFTPVVDFFKGLLGIEDKKEEKKEDEEKPTPGPEGGGEGEGEGGGGGEQEGPQTEHQGTEQDPYSAEDAVLVANSLEADGVTSASYYIKGTVEYFEEAFDASYGNYSFMMEGGFIAWRLKYGPTYQKFNDGDIAVGDDVTVYAQIQNFKGEKPETKGGYVVKVEKQEIDAQVTDLAITGTPKTAYLSGETYSNEGLRAIASFDNGEQQDVTLAATWTYSKETAEVGDTTLNITAQYKNVSNSINVSVTVQDSSNPEHAGTEQDPYTGADAMIVGNKLDAGQATEASYYIKGTVVSFEESFNPTYGNFSFKIDGGFIGWRLKYGPNYTAFTDASDLEVGDEVTMYAQIQNYSGKPETKGGYIVEIDKPVVAPTSIELSQSSLTLEVGQMAQLTATVLPANATNKNVEWTVAQTTGAISCENGLVTALNEGTATVTATALGDPTVTASCEVTVNAATKTLTSVVMSGTPKTEYFAGEAYSREGLTLSAVYSDQSQEDVTAVATWEISKETAEDGDTSITITATYNNLSDSMNVAVTVTLKPGSEQLPYTVAEARAAIDNSGDVTGVYATGIVSQIVTAFNSQYNNVSFNISADGSTTADQLQAYRCKATSADDVAVGDTVTVKGNLKKYNSTYEFDAGCTIEARVQPTVVSVAISGTPAQTEYGVGDSYNHNGLVAIATLSNGGQVDVTSAAVWTPSKATAEQGDVEITYTATYDGVESAAFPIEVTISSSPVVVPGSEEQPYTTAQARDAIDNNGNKTGVYTAGIVNRIAYAYSASSKNMSFYFSDDGSTTNEVEAYKLSAETDPNVEVGDYVVVYGDLTKYNTTYEVNTGCTLAVHTKATVQSVTISGTASQTEYAVGASYNHNGLTATAHLSTNVDVDVTDKATWNFSPVTASLGDTSVSISATYGGVTSTAVNVAVTVSSEVQPVTESYKKVTDASDLEIGDKIVITNQDSTYGLGEYAGGNNVPGTAVSAANNELTIGSASELVLEDAGNGNFYIKIGSAYLYAAAASKNQLKAKASKDSTNGVWAFTYESGHMSIVATGSSNRNVMQYNPNNGSPIFSCYASASQTALQVYRFC